MMMMMYYTKYVYYKGCTYPEYQTSLSEARDLIPMDQQPPIKLHHEPDNIQDNNAIKICMETAAGLLALGYIRVSKIPMVTHAVLKNEITAVKICHVKLRYTPIAHKSMWVCAILITKKRKWLRIDKNNVYNSDISKQIQKLKLR